MSNTMDFGGVIKDVHDEDNHQLHIRVDFAASLTGNANDDMDFGGSIKDAHDIATQTLRITVDPVSSNGYVIVGVV